MAAVVLVTGDAVGRHMAGPAIRVVELGRVLAAAGHAVTIATAEPGQLDEPGIALVRLDDSTVADLAEAADVVVGQGWPLERWPVLRRGPGALVVDLYDPYHLEGLVLDAAKPPAEQADSYRGRMHTLTHQLDDGDFFLCASERQRDMWIGALSACGRVNPRTYEADPTLRALIDVVGFGLPTRPPQSRHRALREAFAEIGEGDLVLLWGGGLYDWFDPLSLVRAVALASVAVPRLRLVFHAAAHPSAAVAPMSVVERTRRLSAELGLTGRHVFFNDGWVPYEDRADWLCDADVGVSTHHPHIETEFAYRTRVLDYLWAGLPILCTAGDVLASEVDRRQLGLTVPPEDPAALADAIVRLDDPAVRSACRQRIAEFAVEHTWEQVMQPLLRFCAQALRAPDRLDRGPDARPAPDAATPDRAGLAATGILERGRAWRRRLAGKH